MADFDSLSQKGGEEMNLIKRLHADMIVEIEKLETENKQLNLYKQLAAEYGLSVFANIAELQKQRDVLLDAAEAIEINAEECLDWDDCTAMLVSINSYHKLMEAIASAKETK